MKFTKKQFAIKDLHENHEAGLLIRNPEYQRGATWDVNQQRGLVDSVFRQYPIPPLFLHKKSIKSLGGGISDKFEIVDGQQRLNALSFFRKGLFKLFEVSDPKFKVPQSLRSLPAPWSGKAYADLSIELREFFDRFEIDIQLIEEVTVSDEIRDLFIRLQSGTALTPQQVRDAWPGNIGPFIERLAGKLQQQPSLQLFELIDRRGIKSDDDQKDPYVDHRATCAQLLRTYLARAVDPLNFVNLSSKNLDALYHENPGFDSNGRLATEFVEALKDCETILKYAIDSSPPLAGQKKKKFRKSDVICLVAYLQDCRDNPLLKIDSAAKKKFGQFIATYEGGPGGKSPTGVSVFEAYKKFREALPSDAAIRLDNKRLFDDQQRHEIIARSAGLCAVCAKLVPDDEVEIDHYPIAYARGGKTEVANGRLVHQRCHPRYGRITIGSI